VKSVTDAITLEEVEAERGPARRVYRAIVSSDHLSARIADRLTEIGRTVRLPGFRPGKIPAGVLRDRYGAKARAEVIQRLRAEAADKVLARRELASSLELVADRADTVEFRVAVTHLADLPELDFEAIEIERLSGPPSEAQLLDDHLRQSVLDVLDKTYQFPIAPQLIAREHALIRRAAEEALAAGSVTEAMDAELRSIAERRVRLGAVVVEMAQRLGILPVEEELHREHRGAETLAQTWDRLREDKLIGLILSKAKIIDREATAEELRELTEAK
jgi:FKBP-type peptidyl-prolyl cis-trans isomerase (trigger factor)